MLQMRRCQLNEERFPIGSVSLVFNGRLITSVCCEKIVRTFLDFIYGSPIFSTADCGSWKRKSKEGSLDIFLIMGSQNSGTNFLQPTSMMQGRVTVHVLPVERSISHCLF